MDYLVRRKQTARLFFFLSLVAISGILSFACLLSPLLAPEAFDYFCPGTILLLSLCGVYPLYYYSRERQELRSLEDTLFGARLAYFTYSPEEWGRLVEENRRQEAERFRQYAARFESPIFLILHNTVLLLCVVIAAMDLLSWNLGVTPLLLPLFFLLALMNAFRLEPLRIRWRNRVQRRDRERSVYVGKIGLLESWGKFVPFQTKTRRLSAIRLEKPSPDARMVLFLTKAKEKGVESDSEKEFYRLPIPRRQLHLTDALIQSLEEILAELP